MTKTPRLPLLEKVVLTVAQACEIGGMGKTTLYQAINAGRLPAFKRGSRTVILRKDLDRYLESIPPWGSGREKVGEKLVDGEKPNKDGALSH